MLCEFSIAYKTISIAAGHHGYLALQKDMVCATGGLELVTGFRNIAGTKVVSFELKDPTMERLNYSALDTSAAVDETATQFQKCLEAMVSLAELQSTLDTLGREINRTKRIVNAIEYNIIPKLEQTIHFLNMKFEERDREEKLRLKRVKTVIEAKRA
jgi:V/A-type H+-transporting ATPase subunit D